MRTKRYATLDNPDTARVLLRAIDWQPSYYLGSVSCHVVPPAHWLARHRHLWDASEVIVVDQQDEPSLWRAISDADDRHGRPPRMAVVVREAPNSAG